MKAFKPGDWVIDKTTEAYSGERNFIKLTEGHLYFKQNVNAAEWQQNFEFVNGYEVWHPEQGEWCWFYTNPLTSGRIVAPVLKQYNKEAEYMIAERLIINGQFTNIDDKFAFYKLDLIEPFNGQLPSILKESK